MRAAALRAAREQVLASHWDQVRMADIAVEVGVSRQTLYNEFGTKDGLARALLTDDVDQSLAEIAEVLDAVPDGPDPVGAAPGAGCPPALRQALAASASHVITRAHDDPLHKAILKNYFRHLLLEVAGYWDQIIVPELTVEEPMYRVGDRRVMHVLSGKAAVDRAVHAVDA